MAILRRIIFDFSFTNALLSMYQSPHAISPCQRSLYVSILPVSADLGQYFGSVSFQGKERRRFVRRILLCLICQGGESTFCGGHGGREGRGGYRTSPRFSRKGADTSLPRSPGALPGRENQLFSERNHSLTNDEPSFVD
jgi:hypothetical protein